jgi:hypothetical protein
MDHITSSMNIDHHRAARNTLKYIFGAIKKLLNRELTNSLEFQLGEKIFIFRQLASSCVTLVINRSNIKS